MSKEQIVERIHADAHSEAEELIRAATAQADSIVAEAASRAKDLHAETEKEVMERTQRILDGKAATARLDSAKILLAEKRQLLKDIYAQALDDLLALNERDTLALLEQMLLEHAEKGDEIVLCEGFRFAAGVGALPVVKERALTVSKDRAPVKGGCVLRGKTCDKDLSFAALIEADMEEHQAEIAERLFGN